MNLRPSSNVVLVHCCINANFSEPREPHTCNNIDRNTEGGGKFLVIGVHIV
jgi:hypothetical protein